MCVYNDNNVDLSDIVRAKLDIDSYEWPEFDDYEMDGNVNEESDFRICYVAIDYHSDEPMDSVVKIHNTYEDALYDLYRRFDDVYNLCIDEIMDYDAGRIRDLFVSPNENDDVIQCDGLFEVYNSNRNEYHYGYINQLICDSKGRQMSIGLNSDVFSHWVGLAREKVLAAYETSDEHDGYFKNIGYGDFNAIIAFIEQCSKHGITMCKDIKLDYKTGKKYSRSELYGGN